MNGSKKEDDVNAKEKEGINEMKTIFKSTRNPPFNLTDISQVIVHLSRGNSLSERKFFKVMVTV